MSASAFRCRSEEWRPDCGAQCGRGEPRGRKPSVRERFRGRPEALAGKPSSLGREERVRSYA